MMFFALENISDHVINLNGITGNGKLVTLLPKSTKYFPKNHFNKRFMKVVTTVYPKMISVSEVTSIPESKDTSSDNEIQKDQENTGENEKESEIKNLDDNSDPSDVEEETKSEPTKEQEIMSLVATKSRDELVELCQSMGIDARGGAETLATKLVEGGYSTSI